MATRLMDLRQIREQKIGRSRAWIYAEISAGRFPQPLPLKNSSRNLWSEEEVDAWLADFIAKAKESEVNTKGRRTAKALAARAAELVDAR